MLSITIKGDEFWDDDLEQFVYSEDVVLEFEHSLVSLSKWEAKFRKPFLTPETRTEEEMLGYVVAMLVTPDVSHDTFARMNEEHFNEINDYINDPMTGSTITELPQQGSRSSERISAELIYFWMSHYRIPYEARTWHLNQLFTLIKIHDAKNRKPKQMSKQTRAQQMAELNAQRKAKTGSSG